MILQLLHPWKASKQPADCMSARMLTLISTLWELSSAAQLWPHNKRAACATGNELAGS
jgi:hypothetical protein